MFVAFITPTEDEDVLRLIHCLKSCLSLCVLTLLKTLYGWTSLP